MKKIQFLSHRKHTTSLLQNETLIAVYVEGSGFGGLEVEGWPLVPKFAG